jgi:hypothetical protein
MMDFALKDRDLNVANGDFLLCATDVDAMAQALSIRLKIFAGEWFLDTRVGLPYLTDILGRTINERLLKKLITDEAKNVLSITEVKEFAIAPGASNRSIAISFKAVLPKNIITINESIEV